MAVSNLYRVDRQDPHRISQVGLHGNYLFEFPIPPSKIYIAASLNAQRDAMRLAMELMVAGFTVASRWVRKDFSDRPEVDMYRDSTILNQLAYDRSMCDVNLEDLTAADTLVLLSEIESSSGGLHFELGHFIGSGKRNILVIGKRTNVFFLHGDVRFLPHSRDFIENAVAWLEAERDRDRTLTPMGVDDEDTPF